MEGKMMVNQSLREQEEPNVIPVWASPVNHEEAMEAFSKVARYWSDHGAFNHIRLRPDTPPGNIGEYIGEGLGFLWNFVVAADPDKTAGSSESA